MKDLKHQIKKRIEYVLAHEYNEEALHKLNEELASYENNLKESAWKNTSEKEKEQVRQAFSDMKNNEKIVSHDEMLKYLAGWREKLSGGA